MAKSIIQKIPTDHSEVDLVVTEWLRTHHILAKDVRAYVIDRRMGQPEVMTLEIFTSGVDEIGPIPLIKFDKDISPEEMEAFKKSFEDTQKQAAFEDAQKRAGGKLLGGQL